MQPGWEYGSHGTHVGGTIAANRDGNGMHGVSFGSDLSVAKRAFNSAREWQRVPTGGYSVVSLTRVSANDDTIARMYQDMNDQGVRALNHTWGLANEPGTLAGLDDILNEPENASYFDVFAKGSLDKRLLQVWAAGNHNLARVTPETSPQAGVFPTFRREFGDNGVNPRIFPISRLLRRQVFVMRLAVPKPRVSSRVGADSQMTCSSTNTQQREFSCHEEFSAKGSAVRRSNLSANLVEPPDLVSSFLTHSSTL